MSEEQPEVTDATVDDEAAEAEEAEGEAEE